MTFAKRLFLCPILFAAVVACSVQPPQESDARLQFDGLLAQSTKGLVKLVGFKKTNAVSRDVGGTKEYDLEWAANLEATQNCWLSRDTLDAVPDPGNSLERFRLTTLRFVEFKSGDRLDRVGTMTFQQAERGWRLIRNQPRLDL